MLGGRGTRISHLYPDLPKALIPVAGKSFLAWQIEWLFRNDIDSVILAAGYQSGKIQDWVARQTFKDKTRVVIETEPLGTGGAVKFAVQFLEENSFWVLNGDSFLPNLNFNAMDESRAETGIQATIAVAPIEDSGRYGTVVFDDTGKIIGFEEKKSRNAGWVNGGVYLLERRLMDPIASNKPVSLENEVFPALAATGKLSAFKCPPPLLDMGTPEGLQNMEEYLQSS